MNNNDTIKILKEILKWQRVQGLEVLRKKISAEKLFTTKKDIIVYYNSDGSKSTRDLAKITGISHVAVQSLWKKWINAGIAESTPKYKGGRCRKLFDLGELGLKLTKINGIIVNK